ncbi:hypothetical protein LXT21_13680 [Myxococcus sp. K38C18041901]|uniref:hypothetical protein n=1 Tax=Myxococcus guangdongensis TaxID=2906760 RepID=UPI0020A7C102|nr:hypothetical protein [Myxococcus guangdongensis]MCP3059830.1 hypothetical protein [Myxococcus guangdongensis]
MLRSMTVWTLVGLLVGCGGMPEEDPTFETQELQSPEVAPPPASEGEVSQSRVTTISIRGATISYDSATDAFRVQDTRADGHSAVAVVYNHQTGSTAGCWNSNGSGTTAVCDRNYPSNPLLSIRACTGESGPRTLVACSGWVTVNAFAPEAK